MANLLNLNSAYYYNFGNLTMIANHTILNTIILHIIETQKIKIHQYPWNLTNLSQVAKLNSV